MNIPLNVAIEYENLEEEVVLLNSISKVKENRIREIKVGIITNLRLYSKINKKTKINKKNRTLTFDNNCSFKAGDYGTFHFNFYYELWNGSKVFIILTYFYYRKTENIRIIMNDEILNSDETQKIVSVKLRKIIKGLVDNLRVQCCS